MATELDHHWQAEDEILNIQTEMDQLSVQLKESNDDVATWRGKVKALEGEKTEQSNKLELTKAEFQQDIADLKKELNENL